MAKLESSLKNMIISLSLISSILSTILGVTYLLTKGVIDSTEKKNINAAIQLVVPPFDNDPVTEQFKINNGPDTFICYPARKNGAAIGYAVKSYTEKGFAGHISLMIGFTPEGVITNTTVLEHRETPGLGTRMSESKFKNQFNGKNPNSYNLSVKKDGGDVDAITAATISSRAFCDAVSNAFKAFSAKIQPTTSASVDTSANLKGDIK